MTWLPDGEKRVKVIFIHFDRMYERDRHTDGQTQHDDKGRACMAPRGKNDTTVLLPNRIDADFDQQTQRPVSRAARPTSSATDASQLPVHGYGTRCQSI